jgi:DNA-binding response OmpR family regulator
MTGNEAMVDEATAHDAGIMLVLSKPMELGELAVAVRRLLDGA